MAKCFALLGHTKCATTFIWNTITSCHEVKGIYYEELKTRDRDDLKREIASTDKIVYIYDPLAIQNKNTIRLVKYISSGEINPIVVYRNPVEAVTSYCTEAFHGRKKGETIEAGILNSISLPYLSPKELRKSIFNGVARDLIHDRFNYPLTARTLREDFETSSICELLFDDLRTDRSEFMRRFFNQMGLTFKDEFMPKRNSNMSYMPRNKLMYTIINFLFWRISGLDSSLLRKAYRRNEMKSGSFMYFLMKWNEVRAQLFTPDEYEKVILSYKDMICEFEKITGLSVWDRWQIQKARRA